MTDSLERKLTELAWCDPAFRKQIEDNPKKALKELGIEVPDHIKLDVRQQRRDTFYYVIPPPANDVDNTKSINQMDLWQSADLFIWIMPEKIKEHLLMMRQQFRRNSQ